MIHSSTRQYTPFLSQRYNNPVRPFIRSSHRENSYRLHDDAEKVTITPTKTYMSLRGFAQSATDQDILSLFKHIQGALKENPHARVRFKSREANGSHHFYVHIEKRHNDVNDARYDKEGSTKRYRDKAVTSDNNILYTLSDASREGSIVTDSTDHFVTFPSLKEYDNLICPKKTSHSPRYVELPDFLEHSSDKEKIELMRFMGQKSSEEDAYCNVGKVREIPYLHMHILSRMFKEGDELA